MKKGYVSVDGLTWRKPGGRHVAAIMLEETVDYTLEAGIASVTLLAFQKICRISWQGVIDTKFVDACKQLDRLKGAVEDLLVDAGWDVHILDTLKKSEAEDYLHSTGGSIQVHQVPFSAEWNIELKLDELCNPDGSVRTKEETLALLKERIGVETFNLEYETEDTRNHILAILEAEELDMEDLHDVNGQELTTGAQEFRWFIDDDEAEEEARVYLTDDDDLWKGAVAAGNTTDGLEVWVQDVLSTDGWAQILGGYDGEERVAQLKDGTGFPYIRTN